MAAQRADRELADAAGARIPVDSAAAAALLAAQLTDGIPLGGIGTEVVADGPQRHIPTQAVAQGANPRILAAAAEQLLDLHQERRLQAAGLAPAAGINQQIHQQPTLAAWLRFGRALTLDAIDHRALTRTSVLFLAAADGAPKGRLSARWNAIIHPAPANDGDPARPPRGRRRPRVGSGAGQPRAAAADRSAARPGDRRHLGRPAHQPRAARALPLRRRPPLAAMRMAAARTLHHRDVPDASGTQVTSAQGATCGGLQSLRRR